MSKGKTTYADAGVSIDRGNRLVEEIRTSVRSTARPGVMSSIGGFGALFDLGCLDYRNPVLVSGTDGVGTKINLAIETGNLHGIGVDLVAMCVNDLLVLGAEPLFFLDYYATAKLEVRTAAEVIKGIVEGCKRAGCALVGGETAEMPGMYSAGDFDLAGFCVGIVEKDRIIDGSRVEPGDSVIALASSGPHSNGYSLIRKLLDESGSGTDLELAGRPLVDILLEPTLIYVKPVLELTGQCDIKAIAHITGGGLVENIPRVIPDHAGVNIDTNSWQWPPVFEWLQATGSIEINEMYRTFNCGVGMVLVVSPDLAADAISLLNSRGETAWEIGRVCPREENKEQVSFNAGP